MEAACSNNSVCEDIGSEPNLPSLNCKDSNTEDEQYASSKIEIQEECNFCTEGKEDSFIEEAVEVPSNGVHLEDSHSQFSEIAATSDEDDLASSMEISTFVEKCLSKCATFPSSELEFSHSFHEEEIPAPLTYKRSVSLPAPSNLVSAMKGGRAQNGIAFGSGLRVKWAPGVYDPPTTSSMPQSAKQGNNHPKLKSKKKDKHKQKHSKGKKKKHVKGHTS